MANINTNKSLAAENGALSMYLKDIEKIPLIGRDEEYDLAIRAKNGDAAARERLVNGNLRFVVSIAKQFQGRGLPLIDLISEGNIGLLTAIDKFEPEKGYHFISYAVWWIRQAILKAIGEKSRMIRLPMNKSADLIQILQAKSNLEKNGYDDASIEAIAAECGMDAQDVLEIMQIARDVSSLDAPVNSEEDTSFGDFIESDEPRPEEVVMDEALKNSVRKILGTLSEKERGIITLRFGLDNNKALSLKEVGEIYNLTKERIRQIEKKVLSNLLENEEVRELKAYIA
ncbi:MAG: RNA polymerase sigma factor RpoD/SigA [Spirochaetales bacterium]|nr:RNA polymerase sigma factor RpoD/SigA [Spirochaetales bacterium]MBQ3829872.1 RNA polymerase sigma factor RpoD/SigA [Spirochaetales bacterium]MBQ9810633.1 RNA polymerase sigma factor RpoD/SigA [Spirochaetales bacterium]MBR4477932.1 RNA polymerase sigma factor RpoD/SigA [Spirochaetales bacterium]